MQAEDKNVSFEVWLESIRDTGMYPLDAPGMSLAGPNFRRVAAARGDGMTKVKEVTVEDKTKKTGKRKAEVYEGVGDVLTDLYRRALREPGFTMPIVIKGGQTKEVSFVPGHIWGQYIKDFVKPVGQERAVDGPHAASVMVIGKMPGEEEDEHRRCFIGPTGEVFADILADLKFKGVPSWYVTNVLKFRPPDDSTTIKVDWLKDCRPLLDEELRLVQPDYILCLGADASKVLLGNKYGVAYMDGRVEEYTYNTGRDPGDPRPKTAAVMTVIHPVMVLRDDSVHRQLERGLARFKMLTEGIRFDKLEEGVDHRVIDTLADLEDVLWEIENDPEKKDDIIAADAEWHGDHPVNKGSYLRTVQLAWKPKHSICVKLRGVDGVQAFADCNGHDATDCAIELLNVFVKGGTLHYRTYRKKRIVGHFFVADLEHLVPAGLDFRDEYFVPLYDLDLNSRDPEEKQLRQFYRNKGWKDRVPAWARTKYEGGHDTGLMCHAIEETAQLGLEALAMRYTTVPRYDTALSDWIAKYKKDNKIKSDDLGGYGMIPDHILCPTPAECKQHGVHCYANYDSDATLRLYYKLDELLDCDYQGNSCREAAWESMAVGPAVFEINTTGVLIDKQRLDFLTEKFVEARTRVDARIKEYFNWPDVNVRSVQSLKEMLFGEKYNGKVSKTGDIVRIRPEGAISLGVQPIINTAKRPRQWADIVKKNQERENSPSTNKQVLAILAQENEWCADQINAIRDHRFLDQAVKTVLRPPDEKDGQVVVDEDGESVYDSGLAAFIDSDGRIRTHLYPTTTSGRMRSARPNLQNLSKARDPDYKRLLGEEHYTYPIRSVFKSSPGRLIITADFAGAELAILSGDETLLEHTERAKLPEDHPNYVDIHGRIAVSAFRLQTEPTKAGLKKIGKSHLRVIAKSVIFGLMYGRSPKAISFAAKEQGVNVTVDDAEKLVKSVFENYPKLARWLHEADDRAIDERWACNLFGRYRRFPIAHNEADEAAYAREMRNAPIQGSVASLMNRGLARFCDMRRHLRLYDVTSLLLQIHDEMVTECDYDMVEYVAEQLIPAAFRIPIFQTNFDGMPTGKGPYYLSLDASVQRYFGSSLTKEEANEVGLHKQSFTGDGINVSYWK